MKVTNMVINALLKAHQAHEELGARGLDEVQRNRFGEKALRADIEAEKAVIDSISIYPVKIISEEHGVVEVGDRPPIYLGILDGIDGSRVYQKERGTGRYTTIFSIFSNVDPVYDDYLVSGAIEHSTRRIFLACKNYGNFVVSNKEQSPIYPCAPLPFSINTKILIDESFAGNVEMFTNKLRGFNTAGLECASIAYIDLILGNAGLVLECTRKNNLEIGFAYGLITEAGGGLVDLNDNSIGNKKFLEYGQQQQLFSVAAISPGMAGDLIKYIKESAE